MIVTWLTHGHGKLKTIAKGALRPRGRFAGVLDLFYACEIAVGRSAKSDLHTLREAALLDSRENLRKNHLSVAAAAYFAQLLDDVTETDHPAPDLYDLCSRALQYLDRAPATQHAVLHFESELARLLGIQDPGITPMAALARAHHPPPSSRAPLLQALPAR